MKQAERLAQIAFVALLLIAAGLTYAIVEYRTVTFWAGAMAAYAHAILAALAWWGLALGRQQQELLEAGGPGAVATPVATTTSTLQGLSSTTDNPAFESPKKGGEVRTLETGFQRVVVVLAALGLAAIAGVIVWLVVQNIQAPKAGQPISISPVALDNGALVAAIGAALGYIALFYATRIGPRTQGYGEAVHGILTMALPGSIAVAFTVLLGFFGYGYAGEVGAAVVATFLFLQSLELFFNAFRSYEGVEEFDQEAVDLQALPLVPMFSSQWIVGLRILLAQTFGLGGGSDGEAGVFARIMPRVLVAVLVVLVAASMLRVVPAGTAAIRERLGQATDDDINNPLQPGLHIVAPWPIDKLVVIPTEQLQQITVGAEEVPPLADSEAIAFSLWTEQHTQGGEEEEYITGDGQLLGGYVGIWWRVNNPSDFYRQVSHSEFFSGKGEEGDEGQPTFKTLVQRNAMTAVIHAFGTHTLQQIMAEGRGAVQESCRDYLQKRLDAIHSGIAIVDLTIKDVHPPQGGGANETQTANGPQLGPARAYENVVTQRENREALINEGKASEISDTNKVKGEAAAIRNEATGNATELVNKARGETAYLGAMRAVLTAHQDVAQQRWYYKTMEDVLKSVNKIFVGQNVRQPTVIQAGNYGGTPGITFPAGP